MRPNLSAVAWTFCLDLPGTDQKDKFRPPLLAPSSVWTAVLCTSGEKSMLTRS